MEVRLTSYCGPFGNYLIQAPRLSTTLRPRLLPRGSRCATKAPSIGDHRGALPPGHKRDRRFDEGSPTNRDLDGRVGREADRVVTCTIVRGEILFGLARLPPGRRRTELEETGRQFLAVLRREPVPERAADFCTTVKLARQQRGLTLDERRPVGSRDGTLPWCDTG